jgi:hypothetical protein
MAYYRRSLALARELWAQTQKRQLPAGDDFSSYRRNLSRGLSQFAATVEPLSKYVGGVFTSRQLAGPTSSALFAPVPPQLQREALAILTKELFSTDSFRFDPAFMQRLGVEQLERLSSSGSSQTEFSLASRVIAMQRTVLDQLMGDGVAARLADMETKVADRRQLLTVSEVHARVADSVWSELKSGSDVESLRRNLQREHVRRVAAGLVRPSSAVAADVRAVNRQVALKLQAELQRTLANGQLSPTTRAHFAESAALLSDALKAPMVRTGV